MQVRGAGSIIVLEEGGEWPQWLSCLTEADGPIVIQEGEGEAAADFSRRVSEELAVIERSGRAVELAVMACSERADVHALRARRVLATAILSFLSRLGRGRSLLFTESERQSGGSRAVLSALASDLADQWAEVGVRVSVRFGQSSRPPQESAADLHVPEVA